MLQILYILYTLKRMITFLFKNKIILNDYIYYIIFKNAILFTNLNIIHIYVYYMLMIQLSNLFFNLLLINY